MSFSDALIERLIPGPLPTVAQIEAQYPPRQLPQGAQVVRIAPSPTGYFHIGGLFAAIINERLAQQTKGVFFVRIEDTDQARFVEGSVALIYQTIVDYGLKMDEGPLSDGTDKGRYGPYYQSRRSPLYRAYIRQLLAQGKAYPCFCTAEDLDTLRKTQEYENIRPGYYGKWATCRHLSEADIIAKLDAGKPFVIRMRSHGHPDKSIIVNDLIKGDTRFPEWDEDTVILKSDGKLPTYHFAHIIDDHLMGTTHVVRGEEWLSSVPRHLQMFATMGWAPPHYAHFAFIQKLEAGNRRKITKRKDPEASMSYYSEQGYPPDAVIEYLLNLANSNFEDWRRANPQKPHREFEFAMKKLGTTGPLFDFVKLDSVSREFIARMSAQEIFAAALTWAQSYDLPLAERMTTHRDYVTAILGIERSGPKIRKDLARWSQLSHEISYFFDDLFVLDPAALAALKVPVADRGALIAAFLRDYNPQDDRDQWFGKIKALAAAHGYAASPKEFQANPAAYRGSVSDVAMLLRVALTGRTQTADLHSVMAVMGVERCGARLRAFR